MRGDWRQSWSDRSYRALSCRAFSPITDAADAFETALFVPIHHTQKLCAATREAPGWTADKRELVGRIDAMLSDVRHGYPNLLDPDDYTATEAFARDAKAAGPDGIVCPSVRNPGGPCFAAIYPDVMEAPAQSRHLTSHWNGSAIDMVNIIGSAQVLAILPQAGDPSRLRSDIAALPLPLLDLTSLTLSSKRGREGFDFRLTAGPDPPP